MNTYSYCTTLSDKSKKIVDQLVVADKMSHERLIALDESTMNANCYLLREVADNFFLNNSSHKEDVSSVNDIRIPSLDNSYTITLRKYSPILCEKGQQQKNRDPNEKVILFVHGGGWVQGSIDTHDNLCRKISNALSMEVVSVNYRLSPEYRFPIPLEDVLSAYLWCVNQGYRYINLSGDSVGGNLCAALCLKLRQLEKGKESYQLPVSQILFYPVLSPDLKSKSFELFGNGYGLTTEWTKYYICKYTGAEYNDERYTCNELVYPILGDVNAFPRTFIVSAACDILLDGQLSFFKKLQNAGIEVYRTVLEGAVHAFATYDKYFNDDINRILAEVKRSFL